MPCLSQARALGMQEFLIPKVLEGDYYLAMYVAISLKRNRFANLLYWKFY
jgi:hypothetical protein